jgi:hyperosmotically inducible periplasmic protein
MKSINRQGCPVNKQENINLMEIIMPTRLLLVLSTLAGGLFLMAAPVRAENEVGIFLAADSVLENTELNTRDKAGTTITPEEQKETKRDIRITAHIRKSVVKNKSLSLDAHNVKIITRNGVVTLRGPVENSAESMAIERIAKRTRGAVRIDNQLEIKTP